MAPLVLPQKLHIFLRDNKNDFITLITKNFIQLTHDFLITRADNRLSHVKTTISPT